jgi:alkanesulfonate monooxygenase SsuD/methylene tetrahydromethanopterin reductase-like flavin-dependent oxidoreductase (luciferase family)
VKRAIFIAPFDELSDPSRVAELAVRAEARGWDGFFLWDHIDYRPPVRALADPWIASEAVMSSRACSATRQVRRSPCAPKA